MKNKLFKLQQKIGAIKKDSKNPYFNSKYFDINKILEVLLPELNELKLLLTQPITQIDGRDVLQTILEDVESKEKVVSSITLPANLEPQKMGSAITYYRRYSLQSLLSLQAEDDDGCQSSPKNTMYPSRPIPKKTVKIQNPNVDLPF